MENILLHVTAIILGLAFACVLAFIISTVAGLISIVKECRQDPALVWVYVGFGVFVAIIYGVGRLVLTLNVG